MTSSRHIQSAYKKKPSPARELCRHVLVLSVLISLTLAQKGNFRPYNPIQNIFDSIFRGPNPGANGANGPPPPPGRSGSGAVSTSGPGNPPPRPTLPIKAGSAGNAGGPLNQQANNQPPQVPGRPPPPPPPPPNVPKNNNLPPGPPPLPPNLRQNRPPNLKRPKNLRPRPHPGNRNQGPRIILRPLTGSGSGAPPHPPHQAGPPHLVLSSSGPQEVSLQDFGASHPLPVVVAASEASTEATESRDSTLPNVSIIDQLRHDVPTLSGPTTQDTLINPADGLDSGDQVNPFGAFVIADDNNLEPQTETVKDFSPSQELLSVPTLAPEFKVVPRGHSGPVFVNKIPVKAFQAATNQISEGEKESDGFYFAKANAEQLPVPAALSRKTPRHLDAAESVLQLQTLGGDDNHSHEQQQQQPTYHSHHVLDKLSERVDQVRELVDCGGNDLGFCDMSSDYPGHMMGHLMSDCQELVYKGFVPVPEDLDELGDNDPIAKYSNSSKSSVRAKQGSWSWKPYSYKKKQICDSELRFIRPGYARDATGKWQVIVQTEELPQRVAIDLCHSPGEPCYSMSDCGRKSRCVQRYNFQHLLAVDPDNLHSCPTIRAFKFPTSCVCHIELSHDHF